MQGFDIAIFESDPDRSFDDAYSSFQYLFSGHDYLTFSCSLPYFQILEIQELSILVCVDEDKRLSFVQENIRYFISFLQFDSFDSSSGFPHRSEIAAFEEQHPSVLSYYTYIIGIVYCFYA